MLGRGPAAAADDAETVALDEVAEHRRELLGRLGEDRLAVGALQRQPGVRNAVHRDGRVLAEKADRIAHVLGPGGAVEADDVDLERGQGRQHRGDVGAEQHLAAVGQQRDRSLNRQRASAGGERLADAEDRRLDLENVLSGLDDDQVAAARDQALGLLGEDLDQVTKRDRAEGRVVGCRQKSGRPDRAGDEALGTGCLARDLGGLGVDLERVLTEAPLVELQPRRLKGVRLEHLGPGLEHRLVNAGDHVGPVEHERFVALAGQPPVVLGAEVELLQRRAHAAVEDDHALARCGEEISVRAHPLSIRVRVVRTDMACLHRFRLSHRAPLQGAWPVAAASTVRVPQPLWMVEQG